MTAPLEAADDRGAEHQAGDETDQSRRRPEPRRQAGEANDAHAGVAAGAIALIASSFRLAR